MRTRGLFVFSLLLAGALAIMGWIAAAKLPDGAMLPTHWNAAGEVDGTMMAGKALAIAPLLTVLLACLSAAIPRLEPLQEQLSGSAAVLRTAWIGLLGVMTIIQLKIAGPALGLKIGGDVMPFALGVLLIALGNVLPKSRPSFFIGARTPWALADPDNWVATQRLAGKAMIVAGLLLFALPFLPIVPTTRTTVTIAAILGSALVPIVYSWWLWQRSKAAAE